MSPDAAFVSGTIGRLVRRAKLFTALEAAGLGAAAAVWSIPLGLLVAVVVAILRAGLTSRPAIVRRLEQTHPSLGNLIVTSEEIAGGALAVPPAIADRVFQDAKRVLAPIPPKAAAPAFRVFASIALAAGTWMVHAAALPGRTPSRSPADSTSPRAETAMAASLQVRVTVQPPAYTHLQPTTTTNPGELRVVENSRLEFTIQSSATAVVLDFNGAEHPIARGGDGAFVERAVATASGFAIVSAGEERRMIPLTVLPDALPSLRVVAPGKDLVFADVTPRISFEARATDDYGLRSLALRYTKVSGSGEQFEFSEGEIPVALEKSSDLEWKGTATRSLRDFGLAEGDMLVYRAVATDDRPGGDEATSDSYFIEISKIGAAAGDAFTLPEEETRYALSQQMLIVKTERLTRSRAAMSPADFGEAARDLAIEQRMIRSEFVFMLGGEIEDEEVEAEQSTELQEGRLANRGQRDLRAATVAMSQAEKHLTDADTGAALVAERAAVAALQRAFARDRYILRALATRTPLDPARRLTGTSGDVVGWRRQLLEVGGSQQALRLRDLIEGLGDIASGTESSAAPRRRLSVLAETALRADPQSAVLREAAASLQRLADSWNATPAAERRRRLDAVTVTIAGQARRVLADPTAAVGAQR